MVRCWIPLHLDQVSAQIDHSRPIWGPFLIVDFLKSIWAPNSSAVVPYASWILDILIPWVHVGRRLALMEAEGRH